MIYIDKRGWLFAVMPGLGESNYKARYNKPEWPDEKWKCLTALPWRKSEAEAEADLKAYAEKHGMTAIE